MQPPMMVLTESNHYTRPRIPQINAATKDRVQNHSSTDHRQTDGPDPL
jgi:hypothetical protein